MDEIKYLKELSEKFLDPDNFSQVILTRQWANTIPSQAGVYAFKENEKVVYVGETGNLRGRIKDLLDSRHHTLRRSIGVMHYHHVEGFAKATNKIKFPDHIELLINDHICKKLQFAYMVVSLGRKELEEMIEGLTEKESLLNKRGKRKSA